MNDNFKNYFILCIVFCLHAYTAALHACLTHEEPEEGMRQHETGVKNEPP